MLTPKIENNLRHWHNDDLLRERFTVSDRSHSTIIINEKAFINFSGNDYLGMATHPKVINAFIQGVQQFGLGSSASALVSGFFNAHQILEEKFAEFIGYERAILFSSGYLANLGVLSTLANRNDAIISDRLCHASILAGIQLSRAEHLRFKHNDVTHAEKLMDKANRHCLLITESVFGMGGDIAPIAEFAAVAQQKKCAFVVDDAHGLGVLGQQGRGASEYFGLKQTDVTCLVTPLGKAFGSMGALVAGTSAVIEALVQFASTYRYSTALPPAIAFAAIEALNVMQTENWRQEKLRKLIEFFIAEARARSLPLMSEDLTPVKAILIADNNIAVKLKNNLMAAGLFVSCIRPPTVPKNTARIRVSLNCMHEEKDILRLLDVLVTCYDKLKN